MDPLIDRIVAYDDTTDTYEALGHTSNTIHGQDDKTLVHSALTHGHMLFPAFDDGAVLPGATPVIGWDGTILGCWVVVTSVIFNRGNRSVPYDPAAPPHPGDTWGIEGRVIEGLKLDTHPSFNIHAARLRACVERILPMANPIRFRCTPHHIGLTRAAPNSRLPKQVDAFWCRQRREGGAIPPTIGIHLRHDGRLGPSATARQQHIPFEFHPRLGPDVNTPTWLRNRQRGIRRIEPVCCTVDLRPFDTSVTIVDTGSIHEARDFIGLFEGKTWVWHCERAKITQWRHRQTMTHEELAEHGVLQEAAALVNSQRGFRMPAWNILHKLQQTEGYSVLVGPSVFEAAPTFDWSTSKEDFLWEQGASPIVFLGAIPPH